MKVEYKAEVRSLELAAMTSGGTPENPRFSHERRRRIKAMFNTTEQGRLARHFESTKIYLAATLKECESLCKEKERESHLKDFANLRAFEAKKGHKRLSNELTAQQKLGSILHLSQGDALKAIFRSASAHRCISCGHIGCWSAGGEA
jgi:hypothetical protein